MIFFVYAFLLNFFLFFKTPAVGTVSSRNWAWLYCVNSQITYSKTVMQQNYTYYPWQYALYKTSDTMAPYVFFAYPWRSFSYPRGGFVIHSKGEKEFLDFHSHTNLHALYAVVDYEFENVQKATKFCEYLQEKCAQDYRYYNAVGYGYSNSNWKGIRAETKNGDGVNCESKFPHFSKNPDYLFLNSWIIGLDF
jgi:hypothetical protein